MRYGRRGKEALARKGKCFKNVVMEGERSFMAESREVEECLVCS